MTASEIIEQLRELGNENTRKIYLKHGAPDNFFGVKIEALKKIQKTIKKNHQLAVELFNTGNSDAMYLAGLIAEPEKMTPELLDQWAEKASWYMISEYTVAWVCSENSLALQMCLKWIESPIERIASSGWSGLSSYLAINPNESIDYELFKNLLQRVKDTIHSQPNRVRYTMNNFIIAIGSYYEPLREQALNTARTIGTVMVDMGGTACKVPEAEPYILKTLERNPMSKKRKSAIC